MTEPHSPHALSKGASSGSWEEQKISDMTMVLGISKQIHSVSVVSKFHGGAILEENVSKGSLRIEGEDDGKRLTLFFARQERRNSEDVMRFKWN